MPLISPRCRTSSPRTRSRPCSTSRSSRCPPRSPTPRGPCRPTSGIATTFCEIARRGLVERLVHVSSSEAYGIGPLHPDGRGSPPRRDHALRGEQVGGRPHHRVVRADLQHRRDRDPSVQQHRSSAEPRILRRHRARSSCGGSLEACRSRSTATASRPGTSSSSSETAEPDRADPRLRGMPGPGAERRDRRRDIRQRTGPPASCRSWIAPDHPVVHTEERPGDVGGTAPTCQAAGLLGHEAPTLSDDALTETVDWYVAVLR